MSLLSRRDRPAPGDGPADTSIDVQAERVALKDDRLIYRACSMGFAEAIGQASPEAVIGRTDVDLFSAAIAREQMALDSRVIFSRQADIASIELTDGSGTRHAMIVRSPVLAPDGSARGVDLRLIGGPSAPAMRSAVTVDHETIVNEGMQGSLIFAGREILFANTQAARMLGFDGVARLTDHAEASDLFDEAERARLADAAARSLAQGGAEEGDALRAFSVRDRHGAARRFAGRVAPVQWGPRRAILFSFVDIAEVPGVTARASGSAQQALAAPRRAATPTADGRVASLEARAARYRQYALSAADFFWEVDAELAFRRVSPDLERVLGVPAEHLNGRTHRQLADHPSNANEPAFWREHVESVSEHQKFRDVEFQWIVGGDTRVIRYSGIPITDEAGGFAGYRGVGCDVTAATRTAQATEYHASHDALTGLANRRLFENRVAEALAATSTERRTHALCYMDLDAFKPVNDTCGHQAGDELLRQLAHLFDDLVRKSDVLARIGGDEFGVFLYNCEVAEALKLANQIRHEVEQFEFVWEDSAFKVGVSIGLVVVDDRWQSLDSLFSAADAACYIAKNEGRNRVSVYRDGEGNSSNRRVATHWVEEIDSALAENRVLLASQKIERLHREPDGQRFEMLMRLRMPDGKLVAPSAFLPSAERYGLSAALDRRMLELTLDWLTSNQPLLDDLRHVSLNLASATFTNDEFAPFVLERLAASAVPPEKLCFELSENATIANLAKASAFMQQLAAVGCRFSIDDFGSGLSSFAWLRRLPVDFLKIHGGLVKDILTDPTDLTLVRAISEISKSMGKRTVAEHVESPRLHNAVRDLGIDFAQGYHVGEPELVG